MDLIVRTSKQSRRCPPAHKAARALTQSDLGEKLNVRQATVSKLEAGEPATQLRILMDALVALDLELVIRPRSSGTSSEIEDLF
ncbi:MAG: helix-turn-helix domain-containing protein [Hyphomicrobium sp.]|nr:helix-turn-helix domain-containing protein [Hyphomicrobium sp.]